MGLGRKGISDAIVTVMLVSVMLTMVTVGVFFARLNLSMQAQATEFENGKSSMISLAQMIEGLSLTKGSASYTRFSISSGGLALTQGTENLKIKVEDITVFEDRINLVRFRGGGGVSSPNFAILRGDPSLMPTNCLIVSPDKPAPLGWVYLKRENGAWVIMDFGRVRVVPSGIISTTRDGLNWDPLNVIEITYVRITYGTLSGSNVYDVCAKVINVTTRTIPFPNDIEVTIRVERGPYSEEYVSDQGGNGTLVFLNIVEVEISVR